MNKKECEQIIYNAKGWNHEQKSVSLSFTGIRTTEDDIYDARRELIKQAYIRLTKLVHEK